MNRLHLIATAVAVLASVSLVSACTTTNETGDRTFDLIRTMDNSCLVLKGAEGVYQVVLSSKPDLLTEEDKEIGKAAAAAMEEICKKPYPEDLNTAISKVIDIGTAVGKVVAKANATTQ